jgi:4a-hydroxytetrahydrobiopterin dehydratase
LDQAAIDAWVASNPGWELDDQAIVKSLTFADFATAFAFMTRIAIIAERMDHHPEWSNVYNRVDVRLTTHDAGGITELDLALAAAIDASN